MYKSKIQQIFDLRKYIFPFLNRELFDLRKIYVVNLKTGCAKKNLLHKIFFSDNQFLDSYHKSFLNQTTLDLRKEKWSFLNREFTVFDSNVSVCISIYRVSNWQNYNFSMMVKKCLLTDWYLLLPVLY